MTINTRYKSPLLTDRQSGETKRMVNLNSLPSDEAILLEWDAFVAALARPAAQTRLRALLVRGFHMPAGQTASMAL
jgi:hypothetical protein